MNWAPVLELLPEMLAVLMLLVIVEGRRRLERVRHEAKVARQEVADVRVELASMRPPKGEE